MANIGALSARRSIPVSLAYAFLLIAQSARAQYDCDDTAYAPDEILVQFRDVPKPVIDETNAYLGGEVVGTFIGDPNLFLVKIPKEVPVYQAVGSYNQNASAVKYAEPNFYYCPVDTFPNDPLLGNQWGLIGGAGIRAPLAWDYSVGAGNVTVADNDTGIDLSHPDFVGNLGAAVSFVGGSAQDTNGHGTHTAGTIAAVGNNGTGVSGVMWNANLMALKICPSNCSLDAAVQAIDYGIQNGASVSNNSWGGGSFSQSLRDAISRADQAGVLFVAAAGNYNSNNDTTPFYPCNYGALGLNNVICVASINSSFNRSSFSNYGANTVHLGAPGSSVLSTYAGSRYATLSGTSMASPHVTGVAGLIWAANPYLSHYDVKNIILSTVRPLPSLPVISGGVLDAGAALQNTPPPPP